MVCQGMKHILEVWRSELQDIEEVAKELEHLRCEHDVEPYTTATAHTFVQKFSTMMEVHTFVRSRLAGAGFMWLGEQELREESMKEGESVRLAFEKLG